MVTSGSVDFTMTAQRVVEKAFSKLEVKASEQTLQAEELQDGLDALNLMLKTWQAQGLHLWTKTEAVLFLDKGKTDYLLGPDGDESCDFDDFVQTLTTSDEAASDTVIEVEDTTDMTALDAVGIQLDSGLRHWTTIASVDSSTQITITTGIPSVSASGSSVFTFASLVDRPMRVIGVRRASVGTESEIPVTKFSRVDYFNQSNKESQGTVVQYYYSPQLGNGRFYVWQTASSVNDFLRFTYERPIEDIDDKTNNLDIPVEWLETVIYNLAARLADDYEAPAAKIQSVTMKASEFLDGLKGWDEEPSSLDIQPDFG